MNEKEHQDIQREAEEVGCYSLLGGWARNLYTHEAFHASRCTKEDGPFYCPECFSDAVVRKCVEKRDHFAHKARLTPVLGSQEGALHKQCKEEICQLLIAKFPDGNWDTERVIPENKNLGVTELRPDISGRINGLRVAIEVQASSLTVDKIIKRAKAYTKRKVALLWLVPLREPLGDVSFRPRLYERYLHSIYYGRTYYWWAGLGLVVKPVHYGPATRHIEYREWYEDGELRSGGDYDAKYKIIKTPLYGEDICIADNFDAHHRTDFIPENERKSVPECLIWRDNLNGWWE